MKIRREHRSVVEWGGKVSKVRREHWSVVEWGGKVSKVRREHWSVVEWGGKVAEYSPIETRVCVYIYGVPSSVLTCVCLFVEKAHNAWHVMATHLCTVSHLTKFTMEANCNNYYKYTEHFDCNNYTLPTTVKYV